ncbi:acetyl/propionyl/methylcrotonyl-CoA carboxylase subunit alpha [Thalassovita mangrovi]|uniref:ATP-grasp domain-containing protein n=1 Tax=Thalassovita mangrovi TaxID=2692236 RepID=A0A6L8LET4_9RHOB|nr:biotin carboxylase N-terminal domain-containing protein [Thalassovita mangrovi]MYM54315.1 ATP-grasp domain-containing protein [Thalassovita mangrovi]
MTETPFDKLLIANRGEIALRVIRTARRMGLATVAVYSDADAGASHVRAADQAVHIGGAAPAESYLNIDAILRAAKDTGADAVHPGYGFLAENAEFAASCAAAGLVFVGSAPETIRRMGDKSAAKAAMIEAGVPSIPGYLGEETSAIALRREAEKMGFPVMIKATAGGGGRGMRQITRYEDFDDAIRSARSEAMSAFGDDTMMLEKVIENPRHVEVQVLADRHGTVLHLGERDCSVQRRHQKLIEESPCPAVDEELRARMGRASVKAAQAIGYEGAGTFEYLLDEQGRFYFMEMNTRLQVEHPVTEALTGLDLVEWQLRIAMGQALPWAQQDIRLDGHAIEVRLCAEDPESEFLPQTGQVLGWDPDSSLRVDHALEPGAEVPPQYDSMIAKLIAHGPSRDDARRQLIRGLRGSAVLGLRSNQGFLADCLAHPVFAEGAATTGFVDQNRCDLLPDTPRGEADAAMVLAAVLAVGQGTQLPHGYAVPVRLGRGGSVFDLRVRVAREGNCEVELGTAHMALRLTPGAGGSVQVTRGAVTEPARLVAGEDTLWLHYDGRGWGFTDLRFAPQRAVEEAGSGRILASMGARVLSVAVAVGDRVVKGQVLAVLEAMKMEHAHIADIDGTVRAIHAVPGAQVAAQALLIELAPDAGAAETP